jgi:nucleoside-diphosphate-sugar epimerase
LGKTILLTGGTGFLGSNLLKRLVGDGYRVVALKRSFSKLVRLESVLGDVRFYNLDDVPLARVFEENPINLVVHCATNYGRRDISPTEIIEANLVLPLHLLQLAEARGCAGFINTDTILDKRVNHYSLSKKQFLDWLPMFSQKFFCANVALEHFYGPFDDRSKFVTRIILDLLDEVESIELTPGEQKRDFIFIDDVVEAFVKVIEFAAGAEHDIYRFEVGSNRTSTIREFVHLTKDLVGNRTTHLAFGALPYRENEVMESNVDITELALLGWRPQVELRDGLARTIELERNRLLK